MGKVVNGQFKKGWLYLDQLNPVAELDSAGNVILRFVYGTKGHVPDYMVKNDTTYRFITDHLGSVRLVVKAANGHVAQRLDYDEFGNVLVNTNPEFQPFGYAGGLFDEQTGLVRFGARDYDAGVGRWLAKDPIRFFGSINLYLYAVNNPVNYIDIYGFSDLVFDRSESTLTLYDSDGNEIGSWTAHNNVAEGFEEWPEGTYDYSWHSPHSDEDENDACGSGGNYIFEVEGHEGMGVHAGRANQGGTTYNTHGCIRTTAEAINQIGTTHSTDPLTSIEVQD